MCWKKPCAVVLTTWVHRFPSQLALSSVELSERKKFCFFHFFIMAGMVCRSRWNKRLDMVIIRHVKSLLLRRFSVSLPHTTLLSCDDLPLGSFIYYVSINPSIYNILRWVAWTMGQTNRRLRVWCSKHGLRTPREEIAFTARPKIQSQSQIFSYGRSIFCLPHRPKFSDFLSLCLHWLSVVRGVYYLLTSSTARISSGAGGRLHGGKIPQSNGDRSY